VKTSEGSEGVGLGESMGSLQHEPKRAEIFFVRINSQTEPHGMENKTAILVGENRFLDSESLEFSQVFTQTQGK